MRSTDWRLDVPTATDELGQLARAFNRLLEPARESRLRMQRSFMADASHELRTPVSVIQNRDGSDARTRGARGVGVSRSADDRARAERAPQPDGRGHAGAGPSGRRRIPADQASALCGRNRRGMCESGDGGRRHARNPHLDTTFSPTCRSMAMMTLLRQMVTNLLDNAVQYTPPGGAVAVPSKATAAVATITVVDTGPAFRRPIASGCSSGSFASTPRARRPRRRPRAADRPMDCRAARTER